MPVSFFDSNVILYLASGDGGKADRAEDIIAEGGKISVQVLNEVTTVMRRTMRMSWPETRRFLSTVRALLEVEALTVNTHDAGIALAERHGFSIYDAMIVASAIAGGCETLWSEDMQHGQVVEGALRIMNPFQAA